MSSSVVMKYEERSEGRGPSPVTVVVYSVLATFIISLVCIAAVSTTTHFLPVNTLWNGLSNFAVDYKVEVTESIGPAEPSAGTILVEVPQLPYTQEELALVKDFVAGGGTLVITDDYGFGNQVLEYLGLPVRFNGGILWDPLFCYRNPVLPRITDFSPEIAAAGVRSVVLNNATVLDGVSGAGVLARSSPQSYLEVPGGTRIEGPFPVMAQVNYGQGRVVLVADSSIFINSMLVLDDNRALLDYLFGQAALEGRLLLDISKVDKGLTDRARDVVLRVRGAIGEPGIAAVILAVIFALSFTGLFRDKLYRFR